MEFLRFLSEFIDVSFVLLFVLLGILWHLMRQASRPGNYWATLFDDDSGTKRSTMRVCSLGAFAVSSAVLLYITINYVKTWEGLKGLEYFYTVFTVVWSGAPVVYKLLEFAVGRFGK